MLPIVTRKFSFITFEISLIQSSFANEYKNEFEITWSCCMINVSISKFEKIYLYNLLRSIQNVDNTTQSCTAQHYTCLVQVNDITFLLFS